MTMSRPRAFSLLAAVVALILPLGSISQATADTTVLRINAGGPALSASAWTADTSSAPSPYGNAAATGNTTFATTSAIDMSSPTIPAGTPAELFQTERYDDWPAPEMAWDLPMAAGRTYELRLYFAEIYSFSPGARVFDVLVDGKMALDDYDVFARAGGGNKAIVERVRGTSDGTIDLDFAHVVENPAIKGIEVVEVGTPDPGTAQLAAVPGSLNFGSVKTGTTQRQTISVTNQAPSGGPSITLSSTSITGTGAAVYSDSFVDGTPVTLAPGSSQAITVTFAPTTTSSSTATLAVSHSGGSSPLTVPLSGTGVTQVPVSFGKSLLKGETSSSPTSLQVGPDGKLYVAQQDGLIKVYAVQRNAANDYAVTGTQTITSVQAIPNHNDNGTVNSSVTTRQVTGLLVAGTAANPVIYVSSSDPRIGGGGSGTETGLDTNSSMVSRLTWNGSSWQKQDLVRGLPRSEENHSANGLQLDAATNTLYLSMGGNTNMGAPSNNFALLPEYALSAAVLSIDLTAIGGSTYDLPTLDDEDRAGTNDANDPFGGNNGKNQAKLVPGGPVQVFNPGFRNPYDLLRTKSGRFYTIDNGANAGWGGVPINEGPAGTCTNGRSEPGLTDVDTFHLVRVSGYGGHPNPTRGNLKNTFNASNPQSPVTTANAIECDWRAAGPERGNLTAYDASTNGLTEYTASNFGGQLTGEILSASFDNRIYRAKLNSTGNQLVSGGILFSGVGSTPLDVTAQGDEAAFPGTIWVADIGSGGIVVFEPADFGGGGGTTCTGANDPGLDEDRDGFTNADELANGTDPCSTADLPSDWDGDKKSDLLDPDDDNDGLSDTSDRYAVDPKNGTTTSLPLNLSWDNEPSVGGGLLNLGFTGLMTNGKSDYRTLFDAKKMTAGGAAGVTTVDEVSEGTAAGTANTQEYGFQTGFVPSSTPFTARTRILAPFAGLSPQDGQKMGLFLGDGDQDDYVSLAVSGTGGGQVSFGKEVANAPGSAASAAVAMSAASSIDLFLTVDPAASTVQPAYAVNSATSTGPRTALGGPVAVPSAWVSGSGTVTSVGLHSTSAGAAPPFPATWDFLRVDPDSVTAKTLSLSPATTTLTAAQNGAAASTTLAMSASSGTPTVTTSSSASWLTVTPTSVNAPSQLTVAANPSGLAAGTYTGTVTASASGYTDARTTVSFTVTAASPPPPPPTTGYHVLLSPTADRANPVLLEGRTVRGQIYVFTTSNSTVRQVRWFVDKPNAKGKAHRTDTAAPFDLQGGSTGTAEPFDTTGLSNGPHTITAAFDLTNGQTQVVTANVTVNQSTAPPPAVKALALSSTSASLSATRGGAAQSTTTDLSTSDGSSTSVTTTSSASWLSSSPSPATAPGRLTVTANPSGLAAGTYTGTVDVAASGYTTARFTVTLTVAEPAAKALALSPSSVSLSATRGGAAQSTPLDVSTSDGSSTPVTTTSSAAWLSASPSPLTAPGRLTLTANPSGLAAGTYTGTVDVTASGFTGARVTVTLTVVEATSALTLRYSTSSDRSNAQPLTGATVRDSIYVFTAPDTGVARVRFYLDTTSTAGTPYRTESVAPFDLGGGEVAFAYPFSTSALSDGVHSVTAAADLTSGGTQVTTASFTVANSTGTGGSWAALPPMPTALGEVATGVINGKLYVVGEGSGATLAYDLVARTWSSSVAPRPFVGHHHAAEVVNGRLYLLGGLGGGSEGKVQIFDPVANSWTQGATMPFVAGSSSSAVIGGSIYVAGGITSTGTTNAAARYDVAGNTWTAVAPMPQGRNHAAAETDGTRLFVFGGRGAGSGDGNVVANGFDTVQVYDPATGTWQSSLDTGSSLKPLPQARGGTGTAVHHDGEFYVFGGETATGAGADPAGVYSRVDVYRPSTNTWRSGAAMPTARHGIFPVLHEGKIHLAGGGTQAGFSASAVFDVYTP